MSSYRIPRGYGIDTVQYQEISEGVRPQGSALPVEAWTGLPPVLVDEVHHDPIVLMPGTFVGIATGGYADGKLFPAHTQTGNITLYGNADDSTYWGLRGGDLTATANLVTAGPVPPLGVIYNKVYSFKLQDQFLNYKRNDNVGVLTDWLIQIPAVTANERLIRVGDLVQISTAGTVYGRGATLESNSTEDSLMGRLMPWDGTAASMKYVIGRCYGKIAFADGTAAADARLKDDTTYTLTTAGRNEFKGLEKVQTVPGLGNAGSGTKGVPTWLLDARADSSGSYYALTILVRL